MNLKYLCESCGKVKVLNKRYKRVICKDCRREMLEVKDGIIEKILKPEPEEELEEDVVDINQTDESYEDLMAIKIKNAPETFAYRKNGKLMLHIGKDTESVTADRNFNFRDYGLKKEDVEWNLPSQDDRKKKKSAILTG